MTRMITIAANTIGQLQKQLEVTSHNIANSQTHGYKSRETSFSEMLTQEVNNQPNEIKEIGRNTPIGIREGSGALMVKAMMNAAQGSIQQTNRPLDFAFLQENQYLKVQAGTENVFTRHGALYISPTDDGQAQLVTSDGFPVLGENNQPIIFSANHNQFSISNTGEFTAMGAAQSQTFNLGIVSIQKPQFLEQKGNNVVGLPNNVEVNEAMLYTELTGENRKQITIEAQALETSNVDLSKELSDMMNTQRAMQFQTRAISIGDQMMGLVNNLR